MLKYGTWQDAHWATKEEVKNSVSPSYDNHAVSGGIPIYYDKESNEMLFDTSYKHTLIVGRTGCKKSRCVIAPGIVSCIKSGENIVVVDVKGELLNMTHGLLDEYGYRKIILNFRDPNLSPDTWNPFDIMVRAHKAGNDDRCQELVDNLVYSLVQPHSESKDDYFFTTMGKEYIGAIIRALVKIAKPSEVNINSVINILTNTSASKKMFSTFENDPVIYPLVSGTLDTAPETRGCIISSAHNHILPFLGRNALLSMLSHNSFSLSTIAKCKKTAIFVILPVESPASVMDLVSIFIQQLYENAVAIAQREYNGTLPNRITFFLDEFANLRLQNMGSIISTCRSSNLRYVICIQDVPQLEMHYAEEAKTIINNCGNHLYMANHDIETIKHISELCGKKYRWRNGISEERALVSPSDLQLLRAGEVLYFRSPPAAPYVCSLPDIDQVIAPHKSMPYKFTPRIDKPIKVFNIQTYLQEASDWAIKKAMWTIIDDMLEKNLETDVSLEDAFNNLVSELKDMLDFQFEFSSRIDHYKKMMEDRNCSASEAHEITDEEIDAALGTDTVCDDSDSSDDTYTSE